MGFEDEYPELGDVSANGEQDRYRSAIDCEGVEAAETEQMRAAAYNQLEEAFDRFSVSTYSDPNGRWLKPVNTYQRARERAEDLDPRPDAVVVSEYLSAMDTDTGRPIHDRGMAVAGAAIADTLDSEEAVDISSTARTVIWQGRQELPDNKAMREASGV